MQLKGLIKIFTAVLILLSLYQLSITLIVKNEEKKMRLKASREASTLSNQGNTTNINKLTDSLYQAITDSMQSVEIFNVPILKKYTYQAAKAEELSLGLDLQGGMNVTLEVSLDDLVRSMSNNNRDLALNRAILDANKQKANSEASFISLFVETFTKENPNTPLATLFTKPSETEIKRTSTNNEVMKRLNEEAKDAIKRTYMVLKTRIDQFGVANPSTNLDENKGIITVELAGVHNPERVSNYLQATAKLQFFETYKIDEIGNALMDADKSLSAFLSGIKTDSNSTDSAKKSELAILDTTKKADSKVDTGSLSGMMANKNAKSKDSKTTEGGLTADSNKAKLDKVAEEHPLLIVLQPPQSPLIPQIGNILKRDTAKLNRYLNLEVVRNKFPANIRFFYGAKEQKGEQKVDPNARIALYAIKMPPTGSARLEGDQVKSTRADIDPITGKPCVYMDFKDVGSQVWKDMTGKNVGGFIAVVLDNRVYSCPTIIQQIDGNTQISGDFSPEEAGDLSNILKSGKLPAPAHIIMSQVVGPTLGGENINKGMISLVLAFIVIFVLMLVYYNTGGMVADISLILNLVFTVGVLAALHATLTMAGIAGLVLTVGMAVDTNVIIFERIKEELSLGKTYQNAVIDGYKRSYAPVLDGHVTTLLTAIILFIFGLGPVKGFATTQILGILLSLFCGILVSRLITDIYTKRERHFQYFTGLSKSIFKKAHFKFVEARKYTYWVTAIVVLLGISTYFTGFNKGVEFNGGRSYTVQFASHTSTEDVRVKLQKYFGEYPEVKTIGSNNRLNITTSYLKTIPGNGVDSTVEKKLWEGLTKENLLPNVTTYDGFKTQYLQESNTVSPTISDDLKRGAVEATIISLIAIFLYILLRFRKWQYSLGTILSLIHDVCVTLAVFSYFRHIVPFALEIDQHFIAAMLTVIGFSMNDTVIVFDRIREYFRKSPNEDKTSVINRAINDTLSRTIMTSLTVFITLLILFFVGGEATKGFAFAMLIGVFTGTYSSIFVAAPVLVDMDKGGSLKAEVDRDARIEELKKLA